MKTLVANAYICNNIITMEYPKDLQCITNLFKQKFGTDFSHIELLPGAGSSRRYYRISCNGQDDVLACVGTNIEENESFIYFSSVFKENGINTPEVIACNDTKEIYLISDLGNCDVLTAKKDLSESEVIDLYKRILSDLIQIQLCGANKIDFKHCFVREEFDRTAMRWDLYYFKYYYLKISGLEFNEQKLENDFNSLLDFLDKADRSFFMYRDFQSRNILLQDGILGYIDFQGGMKGPLQYDVVSLLYQAKANLSEETRQLLLSYYITELQKHISVDEVLFRNQFQGIVFIRILQTLGAYGFRGYIQRKEHFIQSIPQALQNLKAHTPIINKIVPMPYLSALINELPELQIEQ